MNYEVIFGVNNFFAGEDRQVFKNPFPGMYNLVRNKMDGKPSASIISKDDVLNYHMDLNNPTFRGVKVLDVLSIDGSDMIVTPAAEANGTVLVTSYIDNVPHTDVYTIDSLENNFPGLEDIILKNVK